MRDYQADTPDSKRPLPTYLRCKEEVHDSVGNLMVGGVLGWRDVLLLSFLWGDKPPEVQEFHLYNLVV